MTMSAADTDRQFITLVPWKKICQKKVRREQSRELIRSSLRGDDLTSRVARLARPQHHPPALAWADNGLIHRSMWADAVGW
jgi:hypothetical protein